MKISNYRLTRFFACTLIISILFSLIFIVLFESIITDVIFMGLLCISSIILLRLQCVIYENSGSCITFRKHHPFKSNRFIRPFIELPESSIRDFELNKGLGRAKLTLKIDSSRKKKAVIRMFLLGFSSSQNKEISSSLQMIRLKNNDRKFN